MCTYSADISVLHLPLPVFKSCIFIRRHERDLARNHSPDLFFIDRLFLYALSRHHHESHDIYSRRNKTNFLQHAWSSPLHFHPSLNSQFSFELNLQFNLLCRIFSWYSSLLFSFLFFYSISVVKIIGKRIIIEKCKELSEIGLNRQNTQQCSMFFPTLSVRAIYFRGTRDRCLKTSRILWSWRWII